jgi:hypothetical protein
MSGSTRSVTERVSETELEEENEILLLRKRAPIVTKRFRNSQHLPVKGNLER